MCPIEIGDDLILNVPEQVAKNVEDIDALNERIDALDPEAIVDEVVEQAVPEVVSAAVPEVIAEGVKLYKHVLSILYTVNNDSDEYEFTLEFTSLESRSYADLYDSGDILTFFNALYKSIRVIYLHSDDLSLDMWVSSLDVSSGDLILAGLEYSSPFSPNVVVFSSAGYDAASLQLGDVVTEL